MSGAHAAAVVAVGLLAHAGQAAASHTHRAAAPPAQDAARIAAVGAPTARSLRARPALITLAEDGSNVRVLVAPTEAGTIKRVDLPVWSSDARWLYFVGEGAFHDNGGFGYSDTDVYIVSANGGKPHRVTTLGDVLAVAPSPDGRRLLVTRFEHPERPPFTSSLWIVSSDGASKRRLLRARDGQLDHGGSWSPDGRTIAFTRCNGRAVTGFGLVKNTCSVYAVSPTGSGLRRLAGRSREPAFSPDGRLIAFATDRDENGKIVTGADEEAYAAELYVMDADGSNVRRVTRSRGVSEGEPAWSPDGLRLAYSSTGRARFVLQLMHVNADGTCPQRLIGNADNTAVPAPSFISPAWRPGPFTGKRPPIACTR